MSPTVKKALSVVAAAVAGAALVAVQKSLIPFAPESTQIVLVALCTAFAHYLDPIGTADAKEPVVK